jgi:hypothetical protein
LRIGLAVSRSCGSMHNVWHTSQIRINMILSLILQLYSTAGG